MSDQTTLPGGGGTKNTTLFYVLSALLILTFLWRTLTTAHEYLSRTANLLEMGVDALCIAGLIGLRKAGPPALFWIALIAGLGLFAIRLNGDASWWTGHLTYSLAPRGKELSGVLDQLSRIAAKWQDTDSKALNRRRGGKAAA